MFLFSTKAFRSTGHESARSHAVRNQGATGASRNLTGSFSVSIMDSQKSSESLAGHLATRRAWHITQVQAKGAHVIGNPCYTGFSVGVTGALRDVGARARLFTRRRFAAKAVRKRRQILGVSGPAGMILTQRGVPQHTKNSCASIKPVERTEDQASTRVGSGVRNAYVEVSRCAQVTSWPRRRLAGKQREPKRRRCARRKLQKYLLRVS